MMMANSFGFGLLSFIVHVLIIVLVIWLVLWLLRGGRRGRMGMHGMWQAHSALNILNERFAKGDITKEDYEERKKALMGQ